MTKQGFALSLLTGLWACGSAEEAVSEEALSEFEPPPSSLVFPEVDPIAGTVTWSSDQGDHVQSLATVTYLEHRQLGTGWFVLEAVLIGGERRVLVEGKETQIEHARAYGKAMRKDLVERQ